MLQTQHRVDAQHRHIQEELASTVARRDREQRRLASSPDPIDQTVARHYSDFLIHVQEIFDTGESILLATRSGGEPVVGRLAVFNEARDLLLIPWHAPEGQRLLTAPDRILVAIGPDGALELHHLTADPEDLASTIRAKMRKSAAHEGMADPLNTLTAEQGVVLQAIGDSHGSTVLHGPPGSGKSAIVLVELARRLLTHPQPENFRVLFVTGTRRLGERAAQLARMLGVASVTPLPQEAVLRFLNVHDGPTPSAGHHGEADDHRVPDAIDRTFAALEGKLVDDTPIPHPMGPRQPEELAVVRRVRAQRASLPYQSSAKQLRRDLASEYAMLTADAAVDDLVDRAMQQLRPVITPAQLVREATSPVRLPRPLRAAATAYAKTLLQKAPQRQATVWDLIVVDEYQRLPSIVTALLASRTNELLLSGDPDQSFSPSSAVPGHANATVHKLSSSLRLPTAIVRWIDTFWEEQGLTPPRIIAASAGGTVETAASLEQARDRQPDSYQVIHSDGGPEGTISPLDALGLEWPGVVLVDPQRILEVHGPPGLFIAATRAIDRLTLVKG